MRLGGEYVKDTLMKSCSECVGKNVRVKNEKKSVGVAVPEIGLSSKAEKTYLFLRSQLDF